MKNQTVMLLRAGFGDDVVARIYGKNSSECHAILRNLGYKYKGTYLIEWEVKYCDKCGSEIPCA